jgi:glycosyltransferase involved in cell wall biosynthesis
VVPYASPLKIVEYLALGRAIVAPASRNIMEVLRDGENALLFSPDDPAAFGAAIERLSNDPALRARLAVAARRTIEARDLTWVANARAAERHAGALLAPAERSDGRAVEESG